MFGLLQLSILAFAGAAPGAPVAAGALEQAVSCGVQRGGLTSLMARIEIELGSRVRLVHEYAAPSGDLYRLDKPIRALGFTARDIYVQPGRIAMVVADGLASVSQRLQLQAAPFGPASKPAGNARSIVAWRLNQDGLAGRTLVGCEYQDPAAADWLAQINGEKPEGLVPAPEDK